MRTNVSNTASADTAPTWTVPDVRTRCSPPARRSGIPDRGRGRPRSQLWSHSPFVLDGWSSLSAATPTAKPPHTTSGNPDPKAWVGVADPIGYAFSPSGRSIVPDRPAPATPRCAPSKNFSALRVRSLRSPENFPPGERGCPPWPYVGPSTTSPRRAKNRAGPTDPHPITTTGGTHVQHRHVRGINRNPDVNHQAEQYRANGRAVWLRVMVDGSVPVDP